MAENIKDYLFNISDYAHKEEMGIFKFAKELFPNRFYNAFSKMHYEMAILLLQCMDPKYEFAFEKRRYLLVHREAAKSTFCSFLLPMYNIMLKGHDIIVGKELLEWDTIQPIESVKITDYIKIPLQEDFIVIASETGGQAQNFIDSIRIEITSRADLARLFGEKNPKIIEADARKSKKTKTWRVNCFVTSDNTIVLGRGAGQRIRGTNVMGVRPTLMIIDDMYSNANTLTEQSRTKIARWFEVEALNSLDSKRGKCMWLGTLVHQDTVVSKFKNAGWIGIDRPLIGQQDLHHLVQTHTVNGQFKLPNKSECMELQKNIHTLAWKERHTLYAVLFKYNDYLIKGILHDFYREFMNKPMAPELQNITPDTFIQTNINTYQKDNRQIVEFFYENKKWTGTATLYIGLDPAASDSITSDDTAIVVAGYARCYPIIEGLDNEASIATTPNGRVFPLILHIEGGKYAIHNYEHMKGMCESLLKLANTYRLEYINIEAVGTQQNIVREVRTFFREHNRQETIWDEYSNINKQERILSTILPVVHRYKHIICNQSTYIHKLYSQILTLGMKDHDDYCDAYAIAMKRVDIPDNSYMSMFSFMPQQAQQENSRTQQLINMFGKDWYLYI